VQGFFFRCRRTLRVLCVCLLFSSARPVFEFHEANTRVSSRAVGLVLRSLGFLPSRTSAAAARDSFPSSVASVSPGLEILFLPTAHVCLSPLQPSGQLVPKRRRRALDFSFRVSLPFSRADAPPSIRSLFSRSASSREPVLCVSAAMSACL
jgi:hypothetical protein